MGVGAEGAVANKDVAFLQLGMKMGDLVHVVCSQRRRQDFEEEAGAGVKECEQVGHGKAATRPLVSRLAEFALQFGSIGHAEAGAVNVESSMASPAAMVVHRRAEGRPNALQQCLQDFQRETAASPAIGGLTENAVGEVFEPGDGEVAVEDLDDKEVNGRDRIQDAPAKVVAGFAANGGDLRRVENLGDLSLDTPQGSVNVLKHP
jgi:hypothetical protein